MYRLLLADDEESIREGVADFVRRSCPGWEIAALARDGREALALARETLPDAVLTDIAMPHMNGLDFLESLSSILPEAKLLVLSGYDQFEYAVQALRIGVGDYLLKPLDTAKLIAALDRFAAELDAQALRWTQAETLRAGVQRSSALELQGFFSAALLGGELPAVSAACGALIREESSCCCVLCEGLDDRSGLLERLLEQRLYGAAQTVLLRVGAPLRQAIVVCVPRRQEPGMFLMLSHTLTSIAVFCRRTEGISCRFFVGCVAHSPEKLSVSYQQCLQALNYAFPEQAPPVTSYEDVLASKLLPCPELPVQLARDIPAAVWCENRTAFAQNCAALFQWFAQQEICDAVFLRMCVLRLCYAILEKPQPEYSMSYYEFTNFQTEIMNSASLDELRTCFENFVSLWWLRRAEDSPARRSLTERVNEVIEAHLSDIGFSLNDVAGTLFISPNYLRQLFKQETGQTSTEYLTARRMRHARLLLGNPDARIYDIAEQTGYADSRYFSVCFKKFYHMTPSEYQLSLAQGEAVPPQEEILP